MKRFVWRLDFGCRGLCMDLMRLYLYDEHCQACLSMAGATATPQVSTPRINLPHDESKSDNTTSTVSCHQLMGIL